MAKQKWKYDELLHMPLHEIYDLLIFLKEIRVQRNEIYESYELNSFKS